MQVVVSHRTACKAAEVVACCRTPILSAALPPPARRPRRLLVFVNPFGGARRGKKIWDTVVRPVFDKAGIKCTAVETQHGGHARALLTSECWGVDGQMCREQERSSSFPLCGSGIVCLLGSQSLLHAGVCYNVALVQSSPSCCHLRTSMLLSMACLLVGLQACRAMSWLAMTAWWPLAAMGAPA